MRIATLLLLSSALWAQDDPGRGLNFYSIEKETALGQSLADEVVRQSRVVDDAAIVAYVNRVAQSLARNANLQFPLNVRVLDDATFNSYALPGGFIFINTGLLRMVATEAELAVVLSHQIAHVAARHGSKQDTRGQIANLASIPLIFQGGPTNEANRQSAQLAVLLGFLTFSRAYEHEADQLGLQYLYAAAYDPAAYFAFFERLRALEPADNGQLPKVFSTHPPTEDRIDRTRATIATLAPQAAYTVTTPEFDQMRQRLPQ